MFNVTIDKDKGGEKIKRRMKDINWKESMSDKLKAMYVCKEGMHYFSLLVQILKWHMTLTDTSAHKLLVMGAGEGAGLQEDDFCTLICTVHSRRA